MLLVDAVESQLFPLELWPTYILTILFTYDPQKPFAVTQLEKVIAFFFGNRVPLSMACQFFAACSGFPLPLTKRLFSYLYEIWSQPDRRPPSIIFLIILICVREGTNVLMVSPISLLPIYHLKSGWKVHVSRTSQNPFYEG